MPPAGLRPDAFEPRSERGGTRRLSVVVGTGVAVAVTAGGTFVLAEPYLGFVPWGLLAALVFLGSLAVAGAWMLWRMYTERNEPGSVTLRDFAPEVALAGAGVIVRSLWPFAPDWARIFSTVLLGHLALVVLRHVFARGEDFTSPGAPRAPAPRRAGSRRTRTRP
ncbi:hypothetical protein [Anaeromyxobacter oryzae]|uniref:Uncharacterized protein n=1 Tax=Anaeromyxobacter oryzae TaxID=2918170 RepID=A0ABN6MZU9_9BACT|nr:hypothetical protein [Anaeromyxobacter oryzae]BDG06196.1 hypothetical protein AMOR_51920 [Anaeromyxobacter oryzae]